MAPKIEKGTPENHTKNLCDSCSFCHIREDYRGRDSYTCYASAGYGNPIAIEIKQPVIICNKYQDKNAGAEIDKVIRGGWTLYRNLDTGELSFGDTREIHKLHTSGQIYFICDDDDMKRSATLYHNRKEAKKKYDEAIARGASEEELEAIKVESVN